MLPFLGVIITQFPESIHFRSAYLQELRGPGTASHASTATVPINEGLPCGGVDASSSRLLGSDGQDMV